MFIQPRKIDGLLFEISSLYSNFTLILVYNYCCSLSVSVNLPSAALSQSRVPGEATARVPHIPFCADS